MFNEVYKGGSEKNGIWHAHKVRAISLVMKITVNWWFSTNGRNGRHSQRIRTNMCSVSTIMKLDRKSKLNKKNKAHTKYHKICDKIRRAGKSGGSTCRRLVSKYTYRYIAESCGHYKHTVLAYKRERTCTAAGTLQVVGMQLWLMSTMQIINWPTANWTFQ